MSTLTCYVSPSGGRRHLYRDCPVIKDRHVLTITVTANVMDCRKCRARLARESKPGPRQPS